MSTWLVVLIVGFPVVIAVISAYYIIKDILKYNLPPKGGNF